MNGRTTADELESVGFGVVDEKTGNPIRLAMQRLWVTGKVHPVGAQLWVQYQFRHELQQPIEAVYTFALPRDAALRRFVLRGDGFEVNSQLQTVEAASLQYEQAIDEGKLAGYVRQYQDSLTTLNLGNLRPGEEVSVTLEILAGVESHDQHLRFRFPFSVAPSYHCQARSIECPDGAGELELPSSVFGDLILPRWFRDASALHSVGFALEVSSEFGVVRSPSHRVREIAQKNTRIVTLAASSDHPDRDLVLDLPFSATAATLYTGCLPSQPALVTGAHTSNEADAAPQDGRTHWVARVPSPCFGQSGAQSPSRVAFVLDCSGSMEGLPLEQAKVAVKSSLSCLQPHDEFALIAFGSNYESYLDGIIPAHPTAVRAARAWVDNLGTMGGTEILAPLRHAIQCLGGNGSILLITDGQVFEQDLVLRGLAGSGVALHCLGIGEASQDAFLARMASVTNGTSRFVSARERVDEEAMELFAAVRERLAHEVKVAASGTIHVASSRNIYAGRPLLVYGESHGEPPTALHLHWTDIQQQPHQTTLALAPSFIGEVAPLLVGAKRIDALAASATSSDVSGPKSSRESSRTNRALCTLSQEYGLASPAMALVAAHQRHGDIAGAVPHTVVVPVGMPRDQRFHASFASHLSVAKHRPQSAQPRGKSILLNHLADFEDALPASPGSVSYGTPPPIPVPPSSDAEHRFDVIAPSGLPEIFAAFLDANSQPAAPKRESLPEQASHFEPDGGLPAKELEERVRLTLAALLRFIASSGSTLRGPYRAIVQRGVAFLYLSLPQLSRHAATVSCWLHAIDTDDHTLYESIAALGNLPEPPTWRQLTSAAPDPEVLKAIGKRSQC
ncbi:MAG: VWA domain-containing protein [Bryobacterales bacterium]|nr:VWA domain-containing protein [Bryobacterales bacterium]